MKKTPEHIRKEIVTLERRLAENQADMKKASIMVSSTSAMNDRILNEIDRLRRECAPHPNEERRPGTNIFVCPDCHRSRVEPTPTPGEPGQWLNDLFKSV